MPDEQIESQVGDARVVIAAEAPTPSQIMVKAAAKSFDVTDELGRVITIKKPTPLANLDFAKAAGAAGLNQLYLAEVMHLKFVGAIDGEVVATPGSDGELRALYARLGDEGNEAAQKGVFDNFMPKDGDGQEGALKNS